MRSDVNDIYFTAYYLDGTSTSINLESTGYNWEQRTVDRFQLAGYKIISSIKIERSGSSGTTSALDNVVISYRTTDGLNNGDLETGSLSPWTTGSTYTAGVTTNSYYVYEGIYGLSII